MITRYTRTADQVTVFVSDPIMGENGAWYVLVKDGTRAYHMRASYLESRDYQRQSDDSQRPEDR